VAGRYPKEFKEDVVRVARDRGPGETLEQIARDFGIHAITLSKWLKQADIEDGIKPGVTKDQAAELRAARQRIRRLEQEVEVLRRAAAYFSQAHLPGKGSTRS
jgi:transposase